MINFKLNGESISTEKTDTPLLWFLRDDLGKTGTRFGCGKGLCGSCSVLMNGQSVRSCQISVGMLADTEITTIEGISEQGDHPLQKAWVEEKVPQCGYCQSGQIISACSLLKTNPNPSEQEIKDGMSANICRCGTYPRINKAIKRAAEAMK